MVPERALDLERKSDRKSLWGLAEYYASVDEVDLVLEISWANECVTLIVHVVRCHWGCLL